MRKGTMAVLVINLGAVAGLAFAGFTGRLTPSRLLISVGGLLQFDGVYAVFMEISEIERLLRLPPWLSGLASDLWSMVRRALGQKPRTTVGSAVTLSGRFALTGHAAVVLVEGGSVEERLDQHQRQLKDLRKELDELGRRADQERGERQVALTALEARLTTEVGAVQQLLRELSGGFLRGRAIGGGLILVGTLLITIGVWA